MPPQTLPRRLQRILILATIACALAAPSAQAALWSKWTQVQGSGTMVHRVLPVGALVRHLDLRTGAAVQIRQGTSDTVEIDADDNVAPLIEAHRDGDALVIEDRQPFASNGATVTVTVHQLSSLSASGSSAVVATGLIAPDLAIRLGGSSDVRFTNLTAERVDLHTGGSSSVRLQGICNDLDLHLGGSTTIEAAHLEARRVTLHAGGSSQVTVWAKTAFSGAVGGSSDVRYYGVATTDLATGGSSSVKRLGDTP